MVLRSGLRRSGRREESSGQGGQVPRSRRLERQSANRGCTRSLFISPAFDWSQADICGKGAELRHLHFIVRPDGRTGLSGVCSSSICGTVGGRPMKDSYPWYVPFINAILELDRTRVAQRVEFARCAIDERFDDLESRGELLSSDERAAIDGALSELRVLEREVKYRREKSSSHVR